MIDGACEAGGSILPQKLNENHQLDVKRALLSIQKHKMMMEVKTLWNSAYDMLERYLGQQTDIVAVLMSSGTPGGDLDTSSPADVTSCSMFGFPWDKFRP